MTKKFNPDNKVRHVEGDIIMTVVSYKKVKTGESINMLAQPMKKNIYGETDIVICRWYDKISNSYKTGEFPQSDLVLID